MASKAIPWSLTAAAVNEIGKYLHGYADITEPWKMTDSLETGSHKPAFITDSRSIPWIVGDARHLCNADNPAFAIMEAGKWQKTIAEKEAPRRR